LGPRSPSRPRMKTFSTRSSPKLPENVCKLNLVPYPLVM
jgi:hypothetical protein